MRVREQRLLRYDGRVLLENAIYWLPYRVICIKNDGVSSVHTLRIVVKGPSWLLCAQADQTLVFLQEGIEYNQLVLLNERDIRTSSFGSPRYIEQTSERRYMAAPLLLEYFSLPQEHIAGGLNKVTFCEHSQIVISNCLLQRGEVTTTTNAFYLLPCYTSLFVAFMQSANMFCMNAKCYN